MLPWPKKAKDLPSSAPSPDREVAAIMVSAKRDKKVFPWGHLANVQGSWGSVQGLFLTTQMGISLLLKQLGREYPTLGALEICQQFLKSRQIF
jgi:hypothetical protein